MEHDYRLLDLLGNNKCFLGCWLSGLVWCSVLTVFCVQALERRGCLLDGFVGKHQYGARQPLGLCMFWPVREQSFALPHASQP